MGMIPDATSWHLALGLLAIKLLISMQEDGMVVEGEAVVMRDRTMGGRRPCEEIYVVGEGETLHTISDKCGDPFIVERNPHINDPDDVFPGLVIMLKPSPSSMQSVNRL